MASHGSILKGVAMRYMLSSLLILLLAACGEKDDAAIIRDLVKKGAELAVKHDVGDLMDLLAPGFMATPGNHDTQRVKGLLLVAFRSYGKFNIYFPQPSVDFNEEATQAETTVYYALVRENQEFPGLDDLVEDPEKWAEAASKKADLQKLKLTLVKSDGEWKVKKANLNALRGF